LGADSDHVGAFFHSDLPGIGHAHGENFHLHPRDVPGLEVIKKRGKAEVANERELVVAVPDKEAEDGLKRELRESFGDQVHLERLTAEIA